MGDCQVRQHRLARGLGRPLRVLAARAGDSCEAEEVYGGARLPERGPLPRPDPHRRAALEGLPRGGGGAEGEGKGGGPVEPLASARLRHWARLQQRRIRGHGGAARQVAPRFRGVQLLRAGHWQHGGSAALRQRRAEEAVAGASPRGPHSLCLCDDGACRCLERREEHLHQHRARGQRIRRQRAQMVHLGRGRPPLQGDDRYGQNGRARQDLSPAEHGTGAHGYAWCDGGAALQRAGLRRRPARPHGDYLRERARAAGQHHPRRGQGLRDRAGPPRARQDPPLHAPRRHGRARARADVPPKPRQGGIRKAPRAPRRNAGAHCQLQGRDRALPPPHDAGRPHDRHCWSEECARYHCHDQGRRAEHGLRRDRPGNPGLRRHGPLAGHLPRARLR
mmetsp:Transcript_9924/g.40197  ORF Transcript_9924/g.40197 Transcript_9924/m.40197 type:complete len:392 (+) Transcript_9924:1030-2205(+)